jgi:hypothetical protein
VGFELPNQYQLIFADELTMSLQRLGFQEFSKQYPSPTAHTSAESEPENLLALYCQPSDDQRKRRFADTACAAEKYSVSQRTVQHWVSTGLIEAVLAGGKYKVDLQQCAQRREVI